MLIGTYFGGKTKKLDNQWIETKFFILGIPIAPVTTMFVTTSQWNSRQGFEMTISGGSSLHGLLRVYCLIGTVVCFFLSIGSFTNGIGFLPILGFLVCALLLAWSHLECKDAKGEEMEERRRIGSIIGLNALPEWIPHNTRLNLLGKIEQEVREEFGHTELVRIANTHHQSPKQMALAYTYLRYLYSFDRQNSAINQALAIIKNKYDGYLQSNQETAYTEVRKGMDDDLSDDASTQL